MTIKQIISDDLKNAMRNKDQKKVNALRFITSAIKQIEVDERTDVDDTRLLTILDKLAKQRRESISQFEKANRQDLIDQESYELDIISHYLPTPLSEVEIQALIKEALANTGAASLKDMGAVMAQLKPKIQGRADMAAVSSAIKTQLNQ